MGRFTSALEKFKVLFRILVYQQFSFFIIIRIASKILLIKMFSIRPSIELPVFFLFLKNTRILLRLQFPCREVNETSNDVSAKLTQKAQTVNIFLHFNRPPNSKITLAKLPRGLLVRQSS